MKRFIAGFMAVAVMAGLAGCSKVPVNETEVSVAQQEAESSKSESPKPEGLVNHMTDKEKEKTHEVDLRLLDMAAGSSDKIKTGISYEVWNPEDYLADLELHKDELTQDDYEFAYNDIIDEPEDYTNRITGIIYHGDLEYWFLPSADYDGGEGYADIRGYNPDTEEMFYERVEFEDYDSMKVKIRETIDLICEKGLQTKGADDLYNEAVDIMDALSDGTAVKLEPGYIDEHMDELYGNLDKDETAKWEFDKDAVTAIKDDIKEYEFYDEELNRNFIVHVITPPSYDADKAYGALVMTDAIWRFNDVTMLYKEMEEGRGTPYIMVTVSQDYSVDNGDNDVRSDIFCVHKKEFLDFLTDNMMPYLAERYEIDLGTTCLFGHSQGGIFSHYAAFVSDTYENQPFATYFIGSPAFWTPYFTCLPDWEDYKNEYGYFDRNETFDKRLVISGGSDEDKDYEEYYGENDSTLEGIAHLKERLDQHGVTSYEYQILEGNHYNYISKLLKQFVNEN